MRILSPCPCCGSKAVLMTRKEDFQANIRECGSACVSIECLNRDECGLTMFCHYQSSNYESMVEEATDRWNRRTFNA